MEVETRSFGMFAEIEEHGVQLTKAERDILAKASKIAEQVRELARTIDDDFEDTDADTLLAEIEHNAREIAQDGFVIAVQEQRV